MVHLLYSKSTVVETWRLTVLLAETFFGLLLYLVFLTSQPEVWFAQAETQFNL